MAIYGNIRLKMSWNGPNQSQIWAKHGRKCWEKSKFGLKCAGNNEKTGQNGNLRQSKAENVPKWVKIRLNMVGNGEKNQNLDWNGQEMVRKQIKMAKLAKIRKQMGQIWAKSEPNMVGNDEKTGQNGEKTGQNGNLRQDDVENGPKWAKMMPNMVGNGEKDWKLDWCAQEMVRKQVIIAKLAKIRLEMGQNEPKMSQIW